MRVVFAFVAAFLCSTALAQNPAFIPPKGFVPDAETAVTIARAVLIPIYGPAKIQAEEPLKAERHGDTWHVNGTLQCAPNCVGGTAHVEISARNGAILNVIHTK